MLELIRKGPVVFFYNGDSWEIMGGTPDGWRIWGLGRIYPPPGTYWVELTENATVEHRPTNTGVAIKNQKVVTFKEGEMLLAMYAKKGDALMLTQLSPPPLGLGNFAAVCARWWRNGVKASRPRGGYRQRESVDGAPLWKSRHPHYECAGRGNRHAGGVEARQQRAGRRLRPEQRRWACHYQREYGSGDFIHQRQLLRDDNLPHRLTPVGVAHA